MTTMERTLCRPANNNNNNSNSSTILVTTAVRGESLPPPTSLLRPWSRLLPTGRRGG